MGSLELLVESFVDLSQSENRSTQTTYPWESPSCLRRQASSFLFNTSICNSLDPCLRRDDGLKGLISIDFLRQLLAEILP